MTNARPEAFTMEGMIWNANHVLEAALKPSIDGIPSWLFETSVGIILCSAIQGGFFWNSGVGSGIVMKRLPDGKTWSAPSAIELDSTGIGLLVGVSQQDMIIFVRNEETMSSLTYEKAMKVQGQVDVSLGNFGRAKKPNFDLGSATYTIAYSKGGFLGVSIEGTHIGTCDPANAKFYGKETSAEDVFEGKVTPPEEKVKLTLLDEVYAKLAKLEEGNTWEPTPEEEKKKTDAMDAAEKEAETVKESVKESMKASVKESMKASVKSNAVEVSLEEKKVDAE